MNNMWKTFRRSGRVTWKATVVLRIAAWDEMRVRTYRKNPVGHALESCFPDL